MCYAWEETSVTYWKAVAWLRYLDTSFWLWECWVQLHGSPLEACSEERGTGTGSSLSAFLCSSVSCLSSNPSSWQHC